MYCIKCGVELADSEERCPLCGTKVYNPEIVRELEDPPYPQNIDREKKLSNKGLMLIVTFLFTAVIAQLLICELSIPSSRSWAGYSIFALILSYILVVLPMWFKKPNPVIFVPCDFAAILAYLLYIDLTVKGNWFMSFVFPAVGVYAIIITCVVTLCHYVRRGYLYIFGGALIAHGFYMVLLEFLIAKAFDLHSSFHWSAFPLVGCFILGMGLIIIAINKPIQDALRKKLFF